mmetsp:Transcript_16631/g.24882  ORF Transcript_16631/g.24882 Transcript_16631/m.24882 type:complete len:154 (-) Transcript_16631:301-762(-)
MDANGTGNRRGSSLFAASAASTGDVSGPYGRPAYLYGKHDGDLLVDFPDPKSGDGMDDDDAYMNDDGQFNGGAVNSKMSSNRNQTDASKTFRGEAARMEELSNSEDLPGGPNHRPLVGGFAAAAYEAAKAHHYSKKQHSTDDVPKDRVPPPSI